jgi:beta-lactam-binding protein with PASTA domain
VALRGILSAFGKLGLVALLAVAFAFGLLTTVYLSLRSPNITVPDVSGKTYTDGENILSKAGLDIRERASRYKQNVPPGVILDQSPHAGEVIKGGQTVAVVVSRAPKEGEQPVDETVAAERSTERGTEGLDNKNTNANRRKPTNKNSNGNSNSNAAANSNTSLNSNGGEQSTNARNANAGNSNLPVNHNANRNSNTATSTNANRSRTTNSNAGLRIINPTRPAGANANRRPTP